jgi:hypothetical protein
MDVQRMGEAAAATVRHGEVIGAQARGKTAAAAWM